MTLSARVIRIYLLALVACWAVWPLAATANSPDSTGGPILIISSYNPETQQTAKNISEFIDEYNSHGGKHPKMIETMNCKSFSEALIWPEKMREYMLKYRGKDRPALIVILGQEAWAAYLSIDRQLIDTTIPVLCGMVSRNAVMLPDKNANLREWEPESVLFEDIATSNVVSGYLYDYNIDKNIQLIRQLYPKTQNIAFLSDNTYGGVSLQAYVKRQMRNYPDLNLIPLDGRKFSQSTLIKNLENLPDNTVLLLGTWRVDINDRYFLNNTLPDITAANPKVPCFTLTSIGIGHGAVGGYVPTYRYIGKDLAAMALQYVDAPTTGKKLHAQYIPNTYLFDYKKIVPLGIRESDLPDPKQFENRDEAFLVKYKTELFYILALFVVLVFGYFVVFYYFFKVKKLKDALVQSEEDNILILNNLRAEIKYITPDYKIKWFNNAIDGSFQRNPAESQGTYCYKTLYGLDKVCDFCPVDEAIATGERAESTVEMPGNKFITMLATPVYGNNHELIGVVVRSEDVSRDKERERELRAAKERAEESDRLKTAFLANMSHEIRTPLNAIVGFSSVMIADGTSDEERQAYAEIIRTNSDLLLRLINDILDISRLETGKLTFTFAPCEIVSLCSSVITTTSYATHSTVNFVLDAPVESFELLTDVQRLQQVLINLMSNAVKFTHEGSITLGFRIDKENDMAMFSVTDTGCGIPVEKQKLVFERFAKLDEYVQGTGLGLAICKITVKLFGGDIWVDEDYKTGARFVFTHPLHPGTAQ